MDGDPKMTHDLAYVLAVSAGMTLGALAALALFAYAVRRWF